MQSVSSYPAGGHTPRVPRTLPSEVTDDAAEASVLAGAARVAHTCRRVAPLGRSGPKRRVSGAQGGGMRRVLRAYHGNAGAAVLAERGGARGGDGGGGHRERRRRGSSGGGACRRRRRLRVVSGATERVTWPAIAQTLNT